MAKYTLKSNQYIPRKGKSLPSGLPAFSTYYYIVDENDKVINIHTLKPYKGKQMRMFALMGEEGANAFLEKINK